MTVLDLQPISSNPQILHLELGSGCGDFGARFYPECFLSDKESMTVLKERCGHLVLNKLQFDAYNIPARDNRFEKIIMCNPFMYGFSNRDVSIQFFHELHRVLRPDGQVIVIARFSNKFGSASQIKNKLEVTNLLNSLFSFEFINFDSTVQFPGYTFQNLTNQGITFPTDLTTLTCLK